MDFNLQRFGSIFSYQGNSYIWFAYDPETNRIFAARILDSELTMKYQAMATRYLARPNHPLSESLSLCFCILTTDSYKGHAASFHKTGDNVEPDGEFQPLKNSLNDADIAKLKSMILTERAMPKKFVDIVKMINE